MRSSKATRSSQDAHSPIGRLLRQWRAARRMSQLDLALEAGVSARHLSYIETGRSRASRETIGRLADALGMPLRERNVLILAGGFAPEFSESPLRTPALDRMREAVEL
ncbi:MAG TPA: helix-turn-helix transcriptional regulator, partial [Steroidobacteraceae bacterium]